MLVKHIAILFVFSVFVLLPRPSKQEKPEDCVNGKQFWTRHSITDDGACVLCPDHWKNCYNEHIDDQKRCVDSCHSELFKYHCTSLCPKFRLCLCRKCEFLYSFLMPD